MDFSCSLRGRQPGCLPRGSEPRGLGRIAVLRRPQVKTTIALVNCRFVRILFFGCILFTAGVSRFWAQSSQSSAQLRRTILHSRHLGAHGLGYNDRSLTELSQKLSPADVPMLIALLK